MGACTPLPSEPDTHRWAAYTSSGLTLRAVPSRMLAQGRLGPAAVMLLSLLVAEVEAAFVLSEGDHSEEVADLPISY